MPKTLSDRIYDVTYFVWTGKIYEPNFLGPKNFWTYKILVRYFGAQIYITIFQVQNEQDKSILSKYKNAVEKRLRILERQGYVTAVPSN